MPTGLDGDNTKKHRPRASKSDQDTRAALLPDEMPGNSSFEPLEKSDPQNKFLNTGQSFQTFEELHSPDAPKGHQDAKMDTLIRLFYKKGEFVYARADDIIMIESCDHLVKVFLLHEDKIRRTVRANTLKDFLRMLPEKQFLRLGRFCAINLHRLSGGDYNQQTFEFDFKVSIKLRHPISSSFFSNIGR